MRRDLLKSTPLRVTVMLSVIFLVALGLASIVAYAMIGRELAERVDHTLSNTFAVISQSYSDSDVTDLVALVDSHSRTTLDHEQIFQLSDAGGDILAGNLGKAAVPIGWSTMPAAKLGLPGHGTYRMLSGKVGTNALVLGESSDENDALGGLTLAAFAWAAAMFTVFVVVAGLTIAVRAQRRLDGIGGTMRRIGQGELAARIPPSVRNDDISTLSKQVNGALDRLSALVEGMRQVSVDIAHDLKTPLNRMAITI
ncbi:MAG: signal transduction histidine kinase, partial [Hyphomicrobiales bacterium]|nr:signal transduction histidine kinase [Hyphomicrobiales bacterium]